MTFFRLWKINKLTFFMFPYCTLIKPFYMTLIRSYISIYNQNRRTGE